MVKLNSIFVSGVLLFSFLFHGHAQEIKVLTFNIRFASFDPGMQNWEQRKEGVVSLLTNYDFIGLQEVLPVQISDIKESLGDEYGYIFRTREIDTTKGEGSPVLYNSARWELINSDVLWLSDTPEIPGSNTWGAAFNRVVTYGFFQDVASGDQVLVINTHFDHVSQLAREKSIELILEKFKVNFPIIPVILMGDFNVTAENPVYSRIVSTPSLSDSYLSANSTETNTSATFHGWKPETPVDRIDYIFISSSLDAISSEVLRSKHNGNYPSDHFPVRSVLRIRNEAVPKI